MHRDYGCERGRWSVGWSPRTSWSKFRPRGHELLFIRKSGGSLRPLPCFDDQGGSPHAATGRERPLERPRRRPSRPPQGWNEAWKAQSLAQEIAIALLVVRIDISDALQRVVSRPACQNGQLIQERQIERAGLGRGNDDPRVLLRTARGEPERVADLDHDGVCACFVSMSSPFQPRKAAVVDDCRE